MCLDLLRHLAFNGDVSGFVKEPPSILMPPLPVTGMHLQFDPVFFSRVTECVRDRSILNMLPPAKTDLPATPRDVRRRACQFSVEKFGYGDGDVERLTGWYGRCQEMSYPKNAKPVVIVIDVGAEAKPDWLRELPREYKGYPVRYRRSPAAEGHYGAGSKISAGGALFGTLGGMLEDQATSQQFGVTCAHVTGGQAGAFIGAVDANGRIANRIGQVAVSKLPANGPPCNQHAVPEGGVDASLVELTSVPSAPLSSPSTVSLISDIDQDDLLVFEGGTSGYTEARVAAATIWKKILINKSEYCFGDLFSLGSRKPSYVLWPISQAGDSGAWIYEDGAPQSAASRWLGMLIAGDKMQNQSLACYSEHIFRWARAWRPSLALT